MTTLSNHRIESVDFLKGLVMVIMALDHVREYFHYSAFFFDPTDPTQSNLIVFFTRFITHFCAPAFSFLAGLSAFMIGRRKTKKELSVFLLKRGLWLVFIEITIVSFAWYFDFQFRTFSLLVIWALGMSMIFLALLIHLPRIYILIFSLILIAAHNLLDNVHFPGNMVWSMLHDFGFFKLSENTKLFIAYPLIPWIAVMSLGYYFGSFYNKAVDSQKRKHSFNLIGILALALFVILRLSNLYGDPKDFVVYSSLSQNIISFLSPSKYPPSLLFLLMTLGGTFLFLAHTEKLKGRIVSFFSTFGRVPFFYYILHLYLIHLLALLFAELAGFGWQKMILSNFIAFADLKGYGFNLAVVYAVWLAVILMLYPICRKFDKYKQANKTKWWLSYL